MVPQNLMAGRSKKTPSAVEHGIVPALKRLVASRDPEIAELVRIAEFCACQPKRHLYGSHRLPWLSATWHVTILELLSRQGP